MNRELDEKVAYHEEYVEGFEENKKSNLERIIITSSNAYVHLLYLEVMDSK